MFMKSNLSKVLGRLLPQQPQGVGMGRPSGSGMTVGDILKAVGMGGAMMPPAPTGGLTLAQTRPDPEFNINTATNTFFKALGDRVASGQMTLDQARAAQAEMRALQLNPAMANRAAATEIAQRNLQVGPYSPNNVAAIGPMISRGPVPTAQPRGLTLSNVPQQGAAPQPMTAPQGMALGGLMAKYRGGMC